MRRKSTGDHKGESLMKKRRSSHSSEECSEDSQNNVFAAIYREWASTQPDRFRVDAAFCVIEKPHQILWGVTFWIFLAYFAFFEPHHLDWHDSVRNCTLGVLLAVVLYCFLQTKDGLLIRPHPALWRCVHGVCLFHFLFCIALTLMTPDQGLQYLRIIFKDLPNPKPSGHDVFSGTLEVDCRISGVTFIRQLGTPWFTAHVVGWFFKMVMYRDWKFCLVLSVMYELCELSLQWLIPEFQECWWDSIFMDAFGANIIGMLLGAMLLRYLEAAEFDWVGPRPGFRTAVLHFTPFTWLKYQWRFFATPGRLMAAGWLMMMSLITEINVFFFMYALQMPAVHYIHVVRIIFICLLSLNAIPEHYEFMNIRDRRIGHNEWLMSGIVLAECFVNIKYGRERWASISPPGGVWIPWVVSLSLFATWCICYFKNLQNDSPRTVAVRNIFATTNFKSNEKQSTNAGSSQGIARRVMRFIAGLHPVILLTPLLYLMKYYDYD